MLTADRLSQLLDYDSVTGHFIWRMFNTNSVKAGSKAGRVNITGYSEIMVDGKRYKAHRLAWLYTHGRWPSALIDHINRDRNDNRLCNLREATKSENNDNSAVRSDNVSRIKGVSFYSRNGKWRARITANGKLIFLGYFASAEEAGASFKLAASCRDPIGCALSGVTVTQ
jgi:HNH endonuclease